MEAILDPNVLTITGEEAQRLQILMLRKNAIDAQLVQWTAEKTAFDAELADKYQMDVSDAAVDLATGLVSKPVDGVLTPVSKRRVEPLPVIELVKEEP
jgi:hypothetical protein